MKKLLALSLALLCAPALAWDKAPTAKRRLEILAGAASRADGAELASCFAEPPAAAVLQNLFGETVGYEKEVSDLYRTVANNMGAEGLAGLGEQSGAVSELHFLVNTTITVKSQKDEDEKCVATIEFAAKDESNLNGEQTLLLVKIGDDWRVLLDREPWPKDLGPESITELSSALAKATQAVHEIFKGVTENQLTKEQIGAPFATAKEMVRSAWTKVKEARSAAVRAEKDKVAADAAAAAKKEADARQAAEDAAKAEAAKKEQAKKEAAAKAAPPPPPPAPVAVKKKEEEQPEEKKPEPDNTGLYIVFGILAVACMVTVGVLISKIREERGRKRKKGGAPGRSSGRRRERRRGSSSGDDEDG